MHYADELLSMYAGRDAIGRRYLLTRLGALPLGLDHETVVNLLMEESVSADPAVAHQARRELGRLHPPYVRLLHRLERGRAGVWTALHRSDSARADLALARLPESDVSARTAALLARLEPFLPAAMRWAAADGGTGTVASVLAGHMRTDTAARALRKRAARPGASFADAVVLAELGDPDSLGELESFVRARRRDADAIMLLSDAPPARALPLLETLESRADTRARVGIAQALAMADPGRRPLFERLLARGEAWVAAYVLDAIAAAPQDGDLELVLRAYRAAGHEFVRVAAARAAGFVYGAIEFLETVLVRGQPREQAAALEGLARQRAISPAVREAAGRLLASPLLRARVSAILVLSGVEPERVSPAIQELLLAPEPLCRLEAAFVLGYFPEREASSVLSEMARRDPTHAVRVQAVRSLLRQPEELSLPRLLELVASPDPRLAGLAARSLAVAEVPRAGEAAAHVARSIPACAPSAVGGALRALGSLSARARATSVPAPLIDALSSNDALLATNALEGLKGWPGAGRLPAVRALTGHADPRIACRAVLLAALDGDLAALEGLAPRVNGEDPEPARYALLVLLELVCLFPAALRAERFVEVSAALAASARTAPAVTALPSRERPRRQLNPEWPQPTGPVARAVPGDARRRLAESYSRRAAADTEPARVDDVSCLAGLPVGWGELHVLAGRRVSLAAALVIGCAAVAAALEPSTDGGVATLGAGVLEPLPRGWLRSTSVEGSTLRRHGGAAAPLKAGDRLGPGDAVITPARSRASLSDDGGTVVWVGPDSHVEAAAPAGVAGLSLQIASGDILVECPRASIEVAARGARLRASGAAFHIRSAADGTGEVTCHDGGVELTEPGREPRSLTAGQQSALLAAGVGAAR